MLTLSLRSLTVIDVPLTLIANLPGVCKQDQRHFNEKRGKKHGATRQIFINLLYATTYQVICWWTHCSTMISPVLASRAALHFFSRSEEWSLEQRLINIVIITNYNQVNAWMPWICCTASRVPPPPRPWWYHRSLIKFKWLQIRGGQRLTINLVIIIFSY